MKDLPERHRRGLIADLGNARGRDAATKQRAESPIHNLGKPIRARERAYESRLQRLDFQGIVFVERPD